MGFKFKWNSYEISWGFKRNSLMGEIIDEL